MGSRMLMSYVVARICDIQCTESSLEYWSGMADHEIRVPHPKPYTLHPDG